MTAPLVVIGGGGHARAVMDAARSNGRFSVIGFLDPAPCADTIALLGVQRLGGDERASEILLAEPTTTFVLGVGAIAVSRQRQALAKIYDDVGVTWATVVHTDATVSSHSRLDPGAIVLAAAVVGPGAAIGRHAVVNNGVIVEHDVELGEHVVVGPGAILGGGSAVGAGSFVGLGAQLRDHIRLGADVTVAMGAVVVDDVPPQLTVAGVPARPMRTD
jgi:sugar O-acyltransferase (sialic acid O-acetyltransferase NeuD family)